MTIEKTPLLGLTRWTDPNLADEFDVADLNEDADQLESFATDVLARVERVSDFGPIYTDGDVGSGTDNGTTLRAAIEAIQARGVPARLVWPTPQEGAYRFTTGALIEDVDGLTIDFGGSKVINAASIAGFGNNLFQVNDCDDFTLRGIHATALATGNFAGGRSPRKLIEFGGVIRRAVVEDFVALDHQNFAITYGDPSENPALARIEGMTIRRGRIGGDVGPEGDGSGIDIYPRDTAATPSSFGLVLEDLDIDVTRGSSDIAQHGPQCIKTNNIREVTLAGRLRLRGGSTAALTFTNGTQEIRSTAVIETSRANRGLSLNTNNGANVTALAQRASFAHLAYRLDGVSGVGLNAYGYYNQQFPDVRVETLDTDGDVVLDGTTTKTHPFRGLHFGHITLRRSNFFTANPASAQPPIQGLHIGVAELIDNVSGSGTGRLRLGITNLRCDNATVGKVTCWGHDLPAAVDIFGDGNTIGAVTCIGGNPADTASVSAVADRGDRNTFESITLDPSVAHNVDRFYFRNAPGVGRVRRIAGTPATENYSISDGRVEIDAPTYQDVPYAASITPDPLAGRIIAVGELVGNITIENPPATSRLKGSRATVKVTQDATGGRTVTFGGQWVTSGAANAAAGATTVWEFFYDGTRYRQTSRT